LTELSGISRIPKATYYKLSDIPLSVLVIINVSLEKLEAFVFALMITGQYVIGAFEIVLLLFLIDFVIISYSGGQFQATR
jgi:hypothetical protein